MIQSSPEPIEQIRERILKMSDIELLRYGQAARYMTDHGKSNPSFRIQLDEARLEWKRRHSKLPLSESV